MATLVTFGNGLRRIEFSFAPNTPRKIIRLGRKTKKMAESWLAMIAAILADKQQGRPHDSEVSKWLAGLDETMLKRLRAVGLADGVGLAETTLGDFLADYFAKMSGKQSSQTSYGHVRRNLEDFFTKARMMRTICDKDADAWRRWLVDHEKLAGATIARRVKVARMLFRKAVKWKLTADNPFAELKAGSQSNDSRKVFVPAEAIEAVIKECPDTEWKVIVAARPLRRSADTFGDICPSLGGHQLGTWHDAGSLPENGAQRTLRDRPQRAAVHRTQSPPPEIVRGGGGGDGVRHYPQPAQFPEPADAV